MTNEITLTGKIGFKKVITAKSGKEFTTFSLGFYNGKDESNKSKYGNIKVTLFDITNFNDKEEVVIYGYLVEDKFTDKDGNERKALSIIAKDIKASEFKQTSHQEIKTNEDNPEPLNDEIPF